MRTETEPEIDNTPWLSTAYVASLLGISPKLVASMCQQGSVKATKIGGYWKVLPVHVYEYLKLNQNHDDEVHQNILEILIELNGGEL